MNNATLLLPHLIKNNSQSMSIVYNIFIDANNVLVSTNSQ